MHKELGTLNALGKENWVARSCDCSSSCMFYILKPLKSNTHIAIAYFELLGCKLSVLFVISTTRYNQLYNYLARTSGSTCISVIKLNPFVSGSPAELSPTTLSPVNHSLGKWQILPPSPFSTISAN